MKKYLIVIFLGWLLACCGKTNDSMPLSGDYTPPSITIFYPGVNTIYKYKDTVHIHINVKDSSLLTTELITIQNPATGDFYFYYRPQPFGHLFYVDTIYKVNVDTTISPLLTVKATDQWGNVGTKQVRINFKP